MDRIIFGAALLLGAAAVCWMGVLFADANGLAFTVIAVIGGVYAIGCVEMIRFRHGTATLSTALVNVNTDGAIDDLNAWLDRLDPSLRSAVRLRIEGERVGLPAPMLTPYLVGLLVMLGLLGTFVGMVNTLGGSVAAIEGANGLQAIRDGLAAPIRGLSLAFGTSVAGVAASAMLGLMSAVSRRCRVLETRRLDDLILTAFQKFSLVHNRQETYKALQLQTQALPAVADKLDAMAEQLWRLGDTLAENQNQFHRSVKENFSALAAAMDQTVKDNLSDTSQLVGKTVSQVVQGAVAEMTREAQTVNQHLTQSTQENIAASTRIVTTHAKEIAVAWKAGFESHHRSLEALFEPLSAALAAFETQLKTMTQEAGSVLRDETVKLLRSSDELIQSRIQSETRWIDDHNDRMAALGESLRNDLGALQRDEAERGRAAVERLEKLESVITDHLASLGNALEAPMSRLMKAASEAPIAAVKVVEQLRDEGAKFVQRDNRLIEEHQRLLDELGSCSSALTVTANEQRDTIAQLVATSKAMLEDIGTRFTAQVGENLSGFNNAADTIAGSAVELASLGEAFSVAVELFNSSNGTLIENLAGIEASLDKVTCRSDDQLAYYVAQARELIDHSIMSQREIVDALRQLKRQKDPEIEV